MPNTRNAAERVNTRTERAVITLLIPQDGPRINMDSLLTLLYRATRIAGGLMYVERMDSESRRMIEYTPSTPKPSDTFASLTAIDEPG